MFLPEKRRTKSELEQERQYLLQDVNFTQLLEYVPNQIFIINDCRQIIYANKSAMHTLETTDVDVIIGKRPGESLACMHALESTNGCGSTPYCAVCGFANAIQSAEQEKSDTRECNLLTATGKAFTLQVTTKPFTMRHRKYVFCAVEDISDKKMILNLDRIFLHDITNTAGSLSAVAENVTNFEPHEFVAIVQKQSLRLLEEINSHRILLTAESNELKIKITRIPIKPLFENVLSSLLLNSTFSNCYVHQQIEDHILYTDTTLLSRILHNLIKNALEASPKHLPVEVAAKINSRNELICMVKNHSTMPEDVKLQVFQRSFTTKGEGRGFGTYSIKLLTEKYLNGKVDFISELETGTIFTLRIPSKNPTATP